VSITAVALYSTSIRAIQKDEEKERRKEEASLPFRLAHVSASLPAYPKLFSFFRFVMLTPHGNLVVLHHYLHPDPVPSLSIPSELGYNGRKLLVVNPAPLLALH
jgi:hypothetical protein